MKKTMLASMLLLGANIAWGAMVTCPPPQSTVIRDAGSTPQVFTCAAVPDAVAVRYQLSLAFQDNSNAGPALSVLASTTNTAGLANINCTAFGSTNNDNQTLGVCNVTSAWESVAGLAAFDVTVTGGAGSNPLPFNASASVSYETATPEPGTLLSMLIGFGLVCFAKWARMPRLRQARDSGSGGIWPFGD